MRLLPLLFAALLPACAAQPAPNNSPNDSALEMLAGAPSAFEPFTLRLPGSEVTLDMVPVAGGEVDGRVVPDFWLSATEVTWDAFDLFLYGAENDGADAVTRPSIPYISMDRGFGHEGWPVLSLSPKGARAFCTWLEELTGSPFRLPSEDEWRLAAGSATAAELDARAWHRGNSGGRTHAVATRSANPRGLHDLRGNAAEWCVDAEGKPILLGGSYRDAPADLVDGAPRRLSHAWNASDPQIPKSTWWLADGGFTGMRIVCPRER